MELLHLVIAALFVLLQSVIILMLGINIRTNNANSREIVGINGNLGELKVWCDQHEKQDNERHDNEREARRDLWSNLNEIKRKVGTG